MPVSRMLASEANDVQQGSGRSPIGRRELSAVGQRAWASVRRSSRRTLVAATLASATVISLATASPVEAIFSSAGEAVEPGRGLPGSSTHVPGR